MTITPNTPVVNVNRDMSMDHFISILKNAHSPAAGAAGPSYLSVANHRVSVAFALAIFKHESRMGMAGIVPEHKLKNPGATRSTRTGKGKAIQIPGRGPFVRYDTWTDGWDDLAFRLVDPEFVYAKEGRRTIRQIIERWAPSSDGNVPDSYIAAVVRDMNEWIGDMPDTPLKLMPCLIDEGRKNRPGLAMTPTWITIHETANANKGSDAAAHCTYIRSDEAANRPASWHVTVDDHQAFQHLPFDEVAWHAGDGTNGTGNRNSLAIELCVNSDGDWERTMVNAAGIVRSWMAEFGIPIERVVQHGRWNKNTACPARLRAGDWPRFVEMLDGDAAEETERVFPETGFAIRGRIRAKWESLESVGEAFPVIGYPVSEEYEAEKGGSVVIRQRFERAILEYQKDLAHPFDVTSLPLNQHVLSEQDTERLDSIRDNAASILDQVKALQGA